MSISKLEEQLKAYYEQHRNQQLTSKLNETVKTMGETLLLGSKYQELPNQRKDKQEKFTPHDETKQKLQQLMEAWKNNQFTEVEKHLPELTEALDREEQQVRSNIQGVKHELKSHLLGLRSLNQRTNRVQSNRIQVIKKELENLDKVNYDPNQDFLEQEQLTRQHVRENLVTELEKIETDLMKPFQGTGAEKYVQSLINGESVQLSSLSDNEIAELQASLGDHLSLKLQDIKY
ncbi:hypothetical protein HUB97_14170 [Halorubraceae archaeon YAN]|nr:hypothetical protein [Halorubraceae archaeon YAN]